MRRLSPLLLLATLGCPKTEPPAPTATAYVYPDAPRGDVVDDYNGVQVADPYRWLEDPDAPASRTWIEAENALTQRYLEAIPARGAIHDRMTALWNYERFGLPWTRGDVVLFTRNDGLQDQSVLMVEDSPDTEPRVLLDPNTLSEDGTIALGGTSLSHDGTLLAYGLSDGGSDWRTWHLRDVKTGEDLPDTLKWIKWSAPAWTHDTAGFFYTRYPEAENPLEDKNEHHKVYWHKLGDAQADDALVFETPDHPSWGFDTTVSEDGSTLLLSIGEGTEHKNRLYYWPIDTSAEGAVPVQGEPIKLIDDYEAAYSYLGNEGRTFWFYTNLDAPKGRVIAIDLDHPDKADWTSVIPESEDALESVTMVGGRFIGQYLHDAHTQVRTFAKDGTPGAEVALPGIGTAWGFGGDNSQHHTWFAYSSYATPTTIWRYDVDTGESTIFEQPKVHFQPSDYVTEQVFYESKDGTKIPMFLAHRKDVTANGEVPTILYGYGGFNISITPWFSVTKLVWMEMGGLWASANLRGGGEYGEAWHEAGTLAHKQNVFDDYIAAGEWLTRSGWTRTSRLAIMGGSNGGLLVGAAMTQRPDLWGAALPAVGVMDMLRYHLFTIGWAWASDYGRSDDKEMFPVLRAYSPYQNLRSGTRYPSTLITTGDHDDRVVPAHSFKFAAELQHDHTGDNPVLIRIETRAGHGGGKSTSMRIDEAADQWAFLSKELDFPVTFPTAAE